MAVGDVIQMYRRNYICVNPDSSAGPATWRLASPQIVGTPGDGKLYDFDSESPINVDVTTGERDTVTTSMDISQLEDRAD